ncbi:Transcription repressor OFP12 [Linum perenne]
MPTTFLWRNLLKCIPSTSPTPNLFLIDQLPPPPSSTAAATSPATIFNTNYNSLYDVSSSLASTSTFSISTAAATATTSSESDSDDPDHSPPPDFATVLASQRFFFSSPGLSNSIISDSHNKDMTTTPPLPPLEGGVAVNKYSPDPYTDFKKSMEEMIEARRIKDDDARAAADWDYLQQLLTCYLTLNPEHAHKYIISAFADINRTGGRAGKVKGSKV